MTTPLPMTAGRRAALILGVPLALAVIAWTALTAVAFAGQGSYPVRLVVPVHGGTVHLSAGAADVRVTQAPGKQLRLTGTARYSLVRSKVTWHPTASGVTVSTHCRFVTGVCEFNFRAVLPAGKRAVLSDGSGNLTLRGLTGPINAGDGSGNINVSALSGTVSLQDGSGNVNVSALSGTVNVQDGSGDVSGTGLSGPRAVLGDSSGNITVSGVTTTDVTASNGSGNVVIIFAAVPDRVRISDQSGNITLVLPPGKTRYRLNTSTASGNRSVSLPTSALSPHVITVTNQSGDISITN
jgi:hypothetical protein